MRQSTCGIQILIFASMLLIGLHDLVLSMPVYAATAKLNIVSARFKQQTLTVRGSYQGKKMPSDGLVKLYDKKLGSLLNQWTLVDVPAKKNKRSFRFVLNQPIDVPCAVRLSAEGAKNKSKKVTGAPKKNCSTGKTAPITGGETPPSPAVIARPLVKPSCNILEPAAGTAISANKPTSFKARLKAGDPIYQSLKYEWDFAGGAMDRPTGTSTGEQQIEANPTFVRDNSTYRVRLSATDAAGQRCEAAVLVTVGTPPVVLESVTKLAADSEKTAPTAGQAGSLKKTGEPVVMPYEDMSMQCGTDAKLIPNNWVTYLPSISNIKAQVFEKAQLPKVLDANAIELRYLAASNPLDPVGVNSINSTSQNWPLGSRLMQAEIQKTDIFETRVRPPEQSQNLSEYYFNGSWVAGLSQLNNQSEPMLSDEGYQNTYADPPLNPDHGRYMPGIANPFQVNDAQLFSGYLDSDKSFIARLLPLTDIDDAGRVNPYPLYRVEAKRVGTGTTVAATDMAMTVGRDLHCRECHAKGGLGANPEIYPQHAGQDGHDHAESPIPPPDYREPASSSIFDQEYTAIRNLSSLHDSLNPGWRLIERMDEGYKYSSDDVVQSDKPTSCDGDQGCHTTAMTQVPFNQALRIQNGPAPLSLDMHEYHGQLTYTDDKQDIVRDAQGRPARWDFTAGPNPNPLFPDRDAQGKPLPMEQNCLKCHGGQREQCFRDRMFTAGVTCYQCHGGMLAVSGSYKTGKSDLSSFGNRLFWFEQPDCGACHTGNANVGKDGSGNYFSGGVMKTAFDEADPSATPRLPDPLNHDAIRFATPAVPMELDNIGYQSHQNESGNYYSFNVRKSPKAPLFRMGKDTHGDVACSACHGAAHAIWPNRDPNANDNVTANQLQGHAGHIVECNVCHASDAFAKLKNLDGGKFSGLPENSGILGGPHGMHPVHDPNWWLTAQESRTGGLHVNVYRNGGFDGTDQCAACHGDDHTGTRLSKAAVDREYNLPGGIKASWKAGEPMGCDRCHDLAHSFSAKGAGAGFKSNRSPTISSEPVREVSVGKPYEYAVVATDPDNNSLTYSIDPVPVSADGDMLQIDSQTGVITGVFGQSALENFGEASPPWKFEFTVKASDGFGGVARQPVVLNLTCPPGSTWDKPICRSDSITLEPDPNAPLGFTAGETYRHQLNISHAAGLPLQLRLVDAYEGITINESTGLIEWPSTLSATTAPASFRVIATDSEGGEARLFLSPVLCDARHPWDAANSNCQPIINFTSAPPTGINAGDVYSYQALATHRENLPLTYRADNMNNYPGDMSMDAQTGLFTWKSPSDLTENEYNFQIVAEDSSGETQYQGLSIKVCAPPKHYNSQTALCE